ncbi:DUF2971 domain-containing protein [Acinetobacter sp. 187]|uniref:DUF2971 domain-containing protein n=1 Tax=Acinetobacter lanii TaxID=2715163 RepID=UPI0014088BCB|nr:DUF2971 domain-containing protein [Acinetobacter lanii]NHC04835.1 DUF2971 domain-containing protein [Acinetobacter lanii]
MKLYKYRYGSKRDLEALENDYFYVPHPSKLNDPSENLFDEKPIYNCLEFFEQYFEKNTIVLSESVTDLFEIIRKNIGIYSLSKTVKDELLWAYYANSHCGFCIEYDFNKLIELNSITASFEVDYQDNPPTLLLNKVMQNTDQSITELLKVTSGIKSKKWQHEEEFRICTEPFGKFDYDYRAVKAIYFGLRMPKLEKDLDKDNKNLPDYFSRVCQEQVMSALKGRGVKYYQMVLKPKSYNFDYIEIEDLFKNEKKYKDKIGHISKDFIDYEGYGYTIEKKYFDQVAEIIRREPYFYELNTINLATEESNRRGEPIVFAGFFKEENNWKQIKRFFTLNEIEEAYNNLNL